MRESDFTHNLNLEAQIVWKISAFQCSWWKYWNEIKLTKSSIKWKNLKDFARPKQQAALRKLFSLPPDKNFSGHWKKIFSLRYTVTYRSFFSSTWRMHFFGVWECFFVRHQPEISIPPMGLKLKRFCVCLKYITLLYCLSSSSFLHHFFGITGNAERKNELFSKILEYWQENACVQLR